MASFIPSQKTASDFNNGNQYVDMVDSVQAETVNNLIESQLYTQGLAINQPDNTDADKYGTASVSIVTSADGSPKLKFNNLKGNGITSINYVTTNANGDNVYNVALNDGRSYEIVAPKGPTGDAADIPTIVADVIDQIDGTYVAKNGDSTIAGGLTLEGGLYADGSVEGANGVYDDTYRVWSESNRPTAPMYSSYAVTQTSNQTDTVKYYYRSADGTTWYRVWASGWQECGGTSSATAGSNITSQTQLTFPRQFNTVAYNIVANLFIGATSFPSGVNGGQNIMFYDKTLTGVKMKLVWGSSGAESVNRPFMWYACGY